jgi:hypothetical protein
MRQHTLDPDSVTFTPLLIDGHPRLDVNIHTRNRGLFVLPLDPAMASELGETLISYADQVGVRIRATRPSTANF